MVRLFGAAQAASPPRSDVMGGNAQFNVKLTVESKQGRVSALIVDYAGKGVNLAEPTSRNAFKGYLADKLAGSGVTDAQLETALAPGGLIAKAMSAGQGYISVVDLLTQSAPSDIAPVVLRAVPPPAGAKPAAITNPLVPAEVILPAQALTTPPDVRTLQYEAYRGAREVISAKMTALQQQPVSLDNAEKMRELMRARGQLDIAANALRSGAIAAPQIGDDSAASHPAWIIYQAAYQLALSRPVSIFDIERQMPNGAFSDKSCIPAATAAAHRAEATRVAYLAFGLYVGDPLGGEYFAEQPAIAAALK